VLGILSAGPVAGRRVADRAIAGRSNDLDLAFIREKFGAAVCEMDFSFAASQVVRDGEYNGFTVDSVARPDMVGAHCDGGAAHPSRILLGLSIATAIPRPLGVIQSAGEAARCDLVTAVNPSWKCLGTNRSEKTCIIANAGMFSAVAFQFQLFQYPAALTFL
jgi:hypothetical protein